MKKQSFICAKLLSLPVREVWIEIVRYYDAYGNYTSLPVREVWIEILRSLDFSFSILPSLPVREVWIEICPYFISRGGFLLVTSRDGSVD